MFSNIKKLLFCLFLSAPLVLILCCCGENQARSAPDILQEMLAGEKGLPSGKIYISESSPGAPDHLSDSILASLYGEGQCPSVMKELRSTAIFLSSGFSASEFAVFACTDSRDASEVARLCIKRLEALRHFARSNPSEYFSANAKARLDGARIEIYGKWVLMAVCEDGGSAISRAKRALSS